MKPLIRISFMSILTLLLSACTGAESTDTKSAGKQLAVDAGRWSVYEMDGAATQSAAWIEIDPATSTLRASVGCNEMQASYTGPLDALQVGPVAATKKGCPEPLMTQERRLAELLSAATSVRVDDNGVLWLSGSRGMLRARLAEAE